MNFLESRLYRSLSILADLILLNLLWLLACAPVITAFPATAAMFGVVREWQYGRDPGILRGFLAFFRENLRQSLWIGCLWGVFGAALFVDFLLLGWIDSGMLRAILMLPLVIGGFVYAAISVYLFPVMVNYTVDWRTLLKNSLFFAIGHLPTTIACLLMIGVAVAATLFAPIIALASGGITSYSLYRMCNRTFERVNALKEESRLDDASST